MANDILKVLDKFIQPTPSGKCVFVLPQTDPNFYTFSALLSWDRDGFDRLYSTIQAAHDSGAIVDGRGDTIAILPGSYTENITISKQAVALIGIVPAGYERPDLLSTAGPVLSVTAGHGIAVKHIRFAGDGVGGVGVMQAANGFLYEDCVFESATNIGFRHLPNVADDSFTASEGQILDCLIRDCAGGGMTFENPGPPAGVGVTDAVIAGCRFYNNTGHDIFDVYTMGGNNQTFSRSVIRDCYFATLDKVNYIDLSAGTNNDGLIANCFFANKAAGLSAVQVALGNNIVASGLIDSRGIVDAHTF